MADYMSLEEQVEADFCRAHRKALLRRIRTRFRKDTASDELLCFDDLRKIPGAMRRIHRGMRTVLVSDTLHPTGAGAVRIDAFGTEWVGDVHDVLGRGGH